MPLIVKVLAEDLDAWQLENRTEKLLHYRPRIAGQVTEELAGQVQLLSPEPLVNLVGREMVAFINLEKGWMSDKVGRHPEVKFRLKAPDEELRDSRRLRLKIKAVDASRRPPRIILEDYAERANVQSS